MCSSLHFLPGNVTSKTVTRQNVTGRTGNEGISVPTEEDKQLNVSSTIHCSEKRNGSEFPQRVDLSALKTRRSEPKVQSVADSSQGAGTAETMPEGLDGAAREQITSDGSDGQKKLPWG